jgi:hypothetical protein
MVRSAKQRSSELADFQKKTGDPAIAIVKRYRGRKGFMNRGAPKGDTKRHTRAYSIISISPELLEVIEADIRQGKA